MQQHTFVKNASVQVFPVTSGTGKSRRTEAEIIVNDKFIHRFPATSRISKHLDVMPPEHLAERLSGGSFFFINDNDTDHLIDFRDGGYGGFVHTDESIAKFMDIIGFQPESNQALHRRRARRNSDEDDAGQKLVLRKVWSEGEITVPGYATGNEFNSQLSFVWNPYVKTINSSFDLIRLICTNGMIGLTSFLNTRIPLFNRWEEHLDIASRQIQNKVNDTVIGRVQHMASERASVGECMLLEQHAFDRLYAPTIKDSDERERLINILTAVSPKTHLSSVYRSEVFDDKNMADQLPGHLTHCDVFNIATERRSHTQCSTKSSNTALDRFANHILFDDDTDTSGAQLSGPKLSAFSSPERAFFGMMN